MERRAAERQRVRQERLQRQQQQEQQQSADVQVAEESPIRHPEVRRSKMVREMELRAEERLHVREERRQWHKQREEQRLADELAAEEERRLGEEERKRCQIKEQREHQRAEQRKHAERLVALSRQQQHVRQASEFWMRNRLVDVWCAFRQIVIEADEMQLSAWCCYRRALQRTALSAWRQQQLRDRGVRETCRIARARNAEWYFRRHFFRTLIVFLRSVRERHDCQVATARTLLR